MYRPNSAPLGVYRIFPVDHPPNGAHHNLQLQGVLGFSS